MVRHWKRTWKFPLQVDVYSLNEEDRMQIEGQKGKSIGDLPVLEDARTAFLEIANIEHESVRTHIEGLTIEKFEEQRIQHIKLEFSSLYQSNNDLEEFCVRHQVNPINVWYWFKESKVLPVNRTAEVALEFLAIAFRTVSTPLIGQL